MSRSKENTDPHEEPAEEPIRIEPGKITTVPPPSEDGGPSVPARPRWINTPQREERRKAA